MALLPESMNAIHLKEFVKSHKELRVTKIPFPKTNAHSLVIRTTHISPTHVDLLYARGLHQNNRRHAKPPFTLGSDFAGVVVSAPPGSGFAKGDQVYGGSFGAYAEYVVIDLKKRTGVVRKVPKGWTAAEACSVGASGATSLGCFWWAGPVREGSWVLVTGATGGLGTMAVQIAKKLGAKVVALVGKDKRKETMMKDLGVDQCVRYDLPNWEDKVKEATGGGVDLVYDAVGMVESSLKCCRYAGRVVIVGFAGRGGDIEKVRMNRILLKSAAVFGYRFGEHGRQRPEDVIKIWRDFDDMVEQGAIKAVVYDQKYLGLDSLPRALNDLAEHKVWGRAVVQVSDEYSEREKPRL
ncbi:uncharacterized protein PV09_07139 [Verruconis gallopava]|uniref:Enoyl reductase (ER) domain-containing protein n=1 Tax=Verruconis gallopava TaxID=253628 RepID=A0A0D1XGN8_9PEZI|nr:uncharacterized protein PV09_07139 [Verruconis gallopava]KIW01371.1 hypothetical protein PV09_07139 [Verruconis gallopava]